VIDLSTLPGTRVGSSFACACLHTPPSTRRLNSAPPSTTRRLARRRRHRTSLKLPTPRPSSFRQHAVLEQDVASHGPRSGRGPCRSNRHCIAVQLRIIPQLRLRSGRSEQHSRRDQHHPRCRRDPCCADRDPDNDCSADNHRSCPADDHGHGCGCDGSDHPGHFD